MPKKKEVKISAEKRRELISKLIQEGLPNTQEDIREALEAKNIIVTQSTVSRDLRWIGAIKTTNDDDETIYLPSIDERVDIRYGAHIQKLCFNESLIVLITEPGSASLVARQLDSHKERLEILGTIAGDDTIFITPVSCREIKKSVKNIEGEFRISSS